MLDEVDTDGVGEASLPTQWSFKPLKIIKKITVEPLLMVMVITGVAYSMITKQYIYYRLSKDYGIENATKSSACVSSNETDAIKKLQEKVVAESNAWVLYLNVAGFIPSFFCTVLMGSWGDTVGRRPPLICSFIGLLGLIASYLVVMQLGLPVSFLLIGRVICGVCGGFSSMLCSSYAYLADISSHEDRTVRVAIGEATTGVGGILASLLCGIWINAQGFAPPLALLSVLVLLTILYIIFVLPESRITTSNSSLSTCKKIRCLWTCQHYVMVWKMLSRDWVRALKILGILLGFFLQVCVFDGIGDTIVIYEMSKPLCWTSSLIGYGNAARASAFVAGTVVIKCFDGILNDFFLGLMSTISSMGGLVTFAFASLTWMIFLGYGISLLGIIAAPVLRSMISRLVSSDEQGSAFALIACAEATASLVASFIFNGVYSATVGTFPGMVFLVGVGIQVVFLILFSFVFKKTKSDLVQNQEAEYFKLINNSMEEN